MKDIIAYGLDEEELAFVKQNIPSQSYKVINAESYTDLIAFQAFALIINPNKLKQNEVRSIFEYYCEVEFFAETVIFTSQTELPKKIERKIMVYNTFDDMKTNFKYTILSAYRKVKKSEGFSSILSNGIIILSTIRKNPGITTAQLAEELELSSRTIQRYIESLRVAGEWIEYDIKIKGWKLKDNKSILWGDIFNGETN